MEPFTVTQKEMEGISILGVGGYFAADAGRKVQEKVGALLKDGKVYIILDLSACKAINSPGVASVMDVTMKILDDFKGKLVLVGLNRLMVSVFTMAGIIPLAETGTDVSEGIRKIKPK